MFCGVISIKKCQLFGLILNKVKGCQSKDIHKIINTFLYKLSIVSV